MMQWPEKLIHCQLKSYYSITLSVLSLWRHSGCYESVFIKKTFQFINIASPSGQWLQWTETQGRNTMKWHEYIHVWNSSLSIRSNSAVLWCKVKLYTVMVHFEQSGHIWLNKMYKDRPLDVSPMASFVNSNYTNVFKWTQHWFIDVKMWHVAPLWLLCNIKGLSF